MRSLTIAATLAVLCLPLPSLTSPASAATAHNSQAGANGDTTNAQAPLHRHMHRKHKSM